ncbi:MAG TPA: hypothetical protein VFB76_08380 [Candidatus Angelobacter sp.]|nr:hypothetical protein [Candidatus Angelobacter sp.]
MFRRFLAAAVFVWAMIALSQPSNAQTAPGTVATPTLSGNTVLLGNGPTTPSTTFAAPAPTAGISDAGRAGISNSAPLSNNVAPPPNDTVVYYSQPGIQPVVTTTSANELATSGAPAVTAPAENTTNAAEGTAASGEPNGNDFGPSSYAEAGPGPNPNRASLGQIAAQYKAAKSATNAKTLTNQDVEQMLSNKTGVTTAKNMPPLGPAGSMPGEATQSSASSSTTAPSQPQSETAQTSSPAAQGSSPAQSSASSQQTGTPPPAATQGSSAGSEATANSSTTPQINPNQQSNDAQGKSKLPATATFLPLLGLLGLASGGFGLLMRKFRK